MKIEEFQGPYRWLSNFWPCTVSLTLDGEIWTFASVEHGYQTAKVWDPADRQRVALAATPAQAKRIARQCKPRFDWSKMKLQVMEELLRDKFSDPKLRLMLVSTGDSELIEGNTWGDTYWGVCLGVGENNLGKLLMKIREEVRSK